MPLSYQIDKERRLVISTASGVFTYADILRHQKDLIADPNFSADFDQLADFTQVTKLEVTARDVEKAAETKLFSSQSRRAGVVSSHEIFGVGRMFMAYREIAGGSDTIRLFYDRGEAVQWLTEGRKAREGNC